jgi:pimeloyl-ACP methyl ester carboxylesterase
MTTALIAANPGRFGTTVTRLSAGVVVPGTDPSRRTFTIDFRGASGSADPRDVAQVAIATKAVELKQVINEIKRVTGRPKVIVVGHSLGGLVARWYIQRGAGTTPYEGDVAALTEIDTPNLGSTLAAFDERALEFDAFLQCLLVPSINRAELAPGSQALTMLNSSPLPASTPVASIASWQSEFPSPRTDGVVSYESQNLLSVYPQLANSIVFLLDNAVSLGPAQQILHILVNQLPSTIGLMQVIVSAVDRLPQQAPPPASAPAAPQLAMTPGGGTVTVSWTASAAGGAPTGYILRGTYRSPFGSAVPFDLPVGTATAIVVPPNLPGAFTVRVYAVNAAGESPASNELAFTVPPGQ